MAIELRGPYRIAKRAIIEEKAQRNSDSRHIFYQAMLKCRTYEEYLRAVGSHEVQPPPKWKGGPVSGRQEMVYARSARNQWIVDA
jgi:hypothetical protein